MAYTSYVPPVYRGNYFGVPQTAPQPIYQPAPETMGQYMPQYQAAQQAPGDMLWVLNENEATAYPVMPNNSVVLWDKSSPTIYVKSVNQQGVPSMRVLDFVERSQQPQTRAFGQQGNYATVEALNALRDDLDGLRSKIDSLYGETKNTEAKDNE